MIRLIKRYESRKLYDTEESRYVSLDEIAGWVRAGQEIRVIDNASTDDVTAQTLAQIILDEGRDGRSKIPTEVLRDLIRFGERALSSGVEHVQQSMESMVRASIDRLGPVREAREEMTRLRTRLEELEESLTDLEAGAGRKPAGPEKKAARPKSAAKSKTAAKKTRKAPARRQAGKQAKKKAAGSTASK